MDEARLLESLQARLADLNDKVQVYRHDMEADFLRYYHNLLRDVPPSVASQVRQSLAKCLHNYPALSPSLDFDHADSRAFDRPGSGQRHHSPPTDVSVSGSGATEPPGSPRDRDQELQGLFTPSYLPLLDSSPRLPASPSRAITGLSDPGPMWLPDLGTKAEGQALDMDQPAGLQALQDALPVTPQLPARPNHVRRSTDDTTSSVLSDRSEVKTPRSALRRSSTSSKPSQSPRRVRFDFMGAEVLPTASPQASDFMALPPILSASPAEPPRPNPDLYEEPEDFVPPRKISSSEALRALSRAPLDSGTVWTVVNPSSDEIIIEQEEMVLPAPPKPHKEPSSVLPTAPDPPALSRVPEPPLSSHKLGSVSEEPEEEIDNAESSDEEFLSMAKPKSFSKKQVPVSLSPTKESPQTKAATASTNSKQEPALQKRTTYVENITTEAHDEEDDLFHFEGLSAPPRPRANPPPTDDLEEEEEDEDEQEEAGDVSNESKPSLYATSPALHITKLSPLVGTSTPTTAKFQAGSLGSYKGRPVIMPVVRNPEIHAQAASLGQFNTFVGGLDGRSGLDEGDLNSFRASVANTGFSGTPRSFTERLMMEEAQLRNKGGSRLSQ